jgi:hypothetical protein
MTQFKKHRVIYNAKNSIIGTIKIGKDNDISGRYN